MNPANDTLPANVVRLDDKRREREAEKTTSYEVRFELNAEGGLHAIFLPADLQDPVMVEALARNFDRGAQWLRNELIARGFESDKDVVALGHVLRDGTVRTWQPGPDFRTAARRSWLMERLGDLFRLLTTG